MVKLWQVESGRQLAEARVAGELAGEIFGVPLAWSADGSMLAAASANAITLYESAGLRQLRTLEAGSTVYCVNFTPDGRLLLSAQLDLHLTFWDPRNGTRLAHIPTSHQEGAYDMCFSPDGRTLATTVDNVKLWSVATRQEVATLRGHTRNIFAARFSPDGNLLVTSDYEGAVRLWPAPPFEEIGGGQ